jgi:hypothetical protein
MRARVCSVGSGSAEVGRLRVELPPLIDVDPGGIDRVGSQGEIQAAGSSPCLLDGNRAVGELMVAVGLGKKPGDML